MAKNIFFLWTCGLQVFSLGFATSRWDSPRNCSGRCSWPVPSGGGASALDVGIQKVLAKFHQNDSVLLVLIVLRCFFWMIFGPVEVVVTRKLWERMVVGQVRDVLFDEMVLLCFLLNEWSSGSWSNMAKANRYSWIVFLPDMVVH